MRFLPSPIRAQVLKVENPKERLSGRLKLVIVAELLRRSATKDDPLAVVAGKRE
jgi:hypothetical protein